MYGCFVCTYVNVPCLQCLRGPEQGIEHLGKEITVTMSCHRGSLVFLSKVGSTVTHWAVSSPPHKALQDTHRVCRWAHPWQEVGEGCLESTATLPFARAPTTTTPHRCPMANYHRTQAGLKFWILSLPPKQACATTSGITMSFWHSYSLCGCILCSVCYVYAHVSARHVHV